jgi:hypothetical protein
MSALPEGMEAMAGADPKSLAALFSSPAVLFAHAPGQPLRQGGRARRKSNLRTGAALNTYVPFAAAVDAMGFSVSQSGVGPSVTPLALGSAAAFGSHLQAVQEEATSVVSEVQQYQAVQGGTNRGSTAQAGAGKLPSSRPSSAPDGAVQSGTAVQVPGARPRSGSTSLGRPASSSAARLLPPVPEGVDEETAAELQVCQGYIMIMRQYI